MGADARKLRRGKAGVDERRPGLEPACRHQGRDGGDTVLEHDEHAVAAAHAGLAQVLLHDVHRAAKRVPGQTAPIMIDQRERIRGRRRVALDEVVDAARQGIEIEGRLRRHHPRASLIMARAMTSCWICVVPS